VGSLKTAVKFGVSQQQQQQQKKAGYFLISRATVALQERVCSMEFNN
jgi:hypothetical protein